MCLCQCFASLRFVGVLLVCASSPSLPASAEAAPKAETKPKIRTDAPAEASTKTVTFQSRCVEVTGGHHWRSMEASGSGPTKGAVIGWTTAGATGDTMGRAAVPLPVFATKSVSQSVIICRLLGLRSTQDLQAVGSRRRALPRLGPGSYGVGKKH
ncbi:hypothetical protein B0T17DRAFT_511384 [Bombardia bombarda]|uniref:Secreted protein n=1 Tax=Bombardia bombarda TaxID=252184 RepID=A0AA39TIQ9_9PEZI|nr:hypothetical protein B0T17DRAFT_511384 [Bombardia bombarda]